MNELDDVIDLIPLGDPISNQTGIPDPTDQNNNEYLASLPVIIRGTVLQLHPELKNNKNLRHLADKRKNSVK